LPAPSRSLTTRSVGEPVELTTASTSALTERLRLPVPPLLWLAAVPVFPPQATRAIAATANHLQCISPSPALGSLNPNTLGFVCGTGAFRIPKTTPLSFANRPCARDVNECATRGVVPTCQPLRSYAGLESRPAMDANFDEPNARATVSALARGRVHEIRHGRHRPVRPRCRRGGGQRGVAVEGAKAQRGCASR